MPEAMLVAAEIPVGRLRRCLNMLCSLGWQSELVDLVEPILRGGAAR